MVDLVFQLGVSRAYANSLSNLKLAEALDKPQSMSTQRERIMVRALMEVAAERLHALTQGLAPIYAAVEAYESASKRREHLGSYGIKITDAAIRSYKEANGE